MKTLRWADLPPTERDELNAVVRSKSNSAVWTPDDDWFPFILLGLPAAIAATIALAVNQHVVEIIQHLPEIVGEVGLIEALSQTLLRFGFLVPLGLAVWMSVFLVRNWKRRGTAMTSFATVKVRGAKLTVVRHHEVVRVHRQRMRTASRPFTALELFDRSGRKCTFLTSEFLADAAAAAIERACPEAKPGGRE